MGHSSMQLTQIILDHPWLEKCAKKDQNFGLACHILLCFCLFLITGWSVNCIEIVSQSKMLLLSIMKAIFEEILCLTLNGARPSCRCLGKSGKQTRFDFNWATAQFNLVWFNLTSTSFSTSTLFVTSCSTSTSCLTST